MPVPGVERAEQVAAAVHGDHAVLDRAGEDHDLVDAAQQLRVAALERPVRRLPGSVLVVAIVTRPLCRRLVAEEEVADQAVEVVLALDLRPVPAVREHRRGRRCRSAPAACTSSTAG